MVKRNKISNKGSTFVTVIVAIGFIGVLASLVMVITQNSYTTKSVDNQSKNNFYSAEEVVEQLKIGLQNKLCENMIEAYFEVVGSFNLSEDENIRITKFNQATVGDEDKGFISDIVDESNGVIGETNTYYVDVEKLEQLISTVYKNSDEHLFSLAEQKNASTKITVEVDTTNYGTVYIRNLGVKYYNRVGYTNSLFTDIVIHIPTPDFSMIDPDPNVEYQGYALMARNDIHLPTYRLNANGSVWIGDNIKIPTNTGGLSVKGDALFCGKEIVVEDHMESEWGFSIEGNSGLATLAAGQLTTKNGTGVNSNAMKIDAFSCIGNDLLFDGNDTTVHLYGNYNGFGIHDTNPDKSSAIIVNGKNNTLIADTEAMNVGGAAFIQTWDKNTYSGYGLPVNEGGGSILTGDTISIRSNELGYLVPSEFMQGLPNPLTAADLTASGRTSFNDLTQDVKTDLYNSSIGDLLHGDNEVKVLFYNYTSGSQVVYYYLNFLSPTSAAKYYSTKYNNPTNPLGISTRNLLLGLVPVNMSVVSDDFTVTGIYVKKLKATEAGLDGTVANNPSIVYESTINGDPNIAFANTAGDIYSNLYSFLVPREEIQEKLEDINNSITTDADKLSEKPAIDNIINWSAISSDTGSGSILGPSQYNTTSPTGTVSSVLGKTEDGDELIVRIYKGDCDLRNDLSDVSGKTGLIIVTGNLDINITNFTFNGMIISGGKISNAANATINADSDAIEKIFNRAALVRTSGGIFLSDILKGFKYSDPSNSEEFSTIELEGMFTYENWCKN